MNAAESKTSVASFQQTSQSRAVQRKLHKVQIFDQPSIKSKLQPITKKNRTRGKTEISPKTTENGNRLHSCDSIYCYWYTGCIVARKSTLPPRWTFFHVQDEKWICCRGGTLQLQNQKHNDVRIVIKTWARLIQHIPVLWESTFSKDRSVLGASQTARDFEGCMCCYTHTPQLEIQYCCCSCHPAKTFPKI